MHVIRNHHMLLRFLQMNPSMHTHATCIYQTMLLMTCKRTTYLQASAHPRTCRTCLYVSRHLLYYVHTIYTMHAYLTLHGSFKRSSSYNEAEYTHRHIHTHVPILLATPVTLCKGWLQHTYIHIYIHIYIYIYIHTRTRYLRLSAQYLIRCLIEQTAYMHNPLHACNNCVFYLFS